MTRWLPVELDGVSFLIEVEWHEWNPREWEERRVRIDDSERDLPPEMFEPGFYQNLMDATADAFYREVP